MLNIYLHVYVIHGSQSFDWPVKWIHVVTVQEYQNTKIHRTTSRHIHLYEVLWKPSQAQLISVSMVPSEAGLSNVLPLTKIEGGERNFQAGSEQNRSGAHRIKVERSSIHATQHSSTPVCCKFPIQC
jgi:hypothetical protein